MMILEFEIFIHGWLLPFHLLTYLSPPTKLIHGVRTPPNQLWTTPVLTTKPCSA